jgi:hypothetical protein
MGYYRISKSDRSVTLSDTEFAPVDSAVILNDYAMPIEKVYHTILAQWLSSPDLWRKT